MQLSIVIVEYHCIDQIEGCLPTLHKHLSSLQWECIVVSNSEYPQEKIREMQRRLDGARVVINDRNRGYAGGVNRALGECRSEAILVLNPDCRLVDDHVPMLLDLLDAHPDIAVAGPRVVGGTGEIQPSCRRFPKPWTFLLVRSALRVLPGAARERRRYLMEDFDRATPRDVDWLSGGAMLLRKSAIDAVGPMDERFFLYMEDVDWCRRFWMAGWRVVYTPVCTVRHDAQHDSLRGGLRMISSPHTRFHLASLAKYVMKYGLDGVKRPISGRT